METPFIVKKLLEDVAANLKREIERGDVYSVEQRDFMNDIRRQMQKWLTAEQDAAFLKQYPEHAKVEPHRDAMQAIGEFIDVSEYVLCEWPDGESHPRPTHKSINDILAEHFEVDAKALENEKRQMLESLATG